MKTFIKDNFMLHNQTAVKLYNEHAVMMPIFDFHCHLNPGEILENRMFNNLTEIWLAGDHYKWRLMRSNGVEEKYITGDADPYEKFLKWAETVPRCIGNPLYHWTHLELKRYFDIDELLTPKSAPEIWTTCNKKLANSEFSARGLIRKSNVVALCTTDDPADDLNSHREIVKDNSFPVKVYPTFRPDKALHLENKGFTEWISHLATVAEIKISTFEELVQALQKRAEFFKAVGCRVSDHSFGSPNFTRGTLEEAQVAFQKALAGEKLNPAEIDAYKTQLMLALGRIYYHFDFVMQLHVGVIRDTNTQMLKQVGPDAGFDCMGNGISADSLAALLDGMDQTDELPRTIIYSLNDTDNAKIATVIGCFQKDETPSKLQLGTAWWFNDHRDGMLAQMRTLGNHGLLSHFIGMLTDSRSFLSYTRHEYFRRILCDLLGAWAERAEIPMDFTQLGKVVENICFNNSVQYFKVEI